MRGRVVGCVEGESETGEEAGVMSGMVKVRQVRGTVRECTDWVPIRLGFGIGGGCLPSLT